MLLIDVNVFINAHRTDSSHHEPCARWLSVRLAGDEPIGVSELVLSSVVRIVTNHRIFTNPTSTETALDFCAAMLAAPASTVVNPGPRHWAVFDSLCRRVHARANVVPDAYLAALALEHGATFITLDSAFRHFPGLKVAPPG